MGYWLLWGAVLYPQHFKIFKAESELVKWKRENI